MDRRTVAGLTLPAECYRLIDSPRWNTYREDARVSPSLVESVFGEAPDKSWRFYTFDEVVDMTVEWHQEKDPAWFGTAPDDIVPESSVLIGELGYDRPIALDFRTGEPCVRFMRIDGRWPIVADTVGELVGRLEEGE